MLELKNAVRLAGLKLKTEVVDRGNGLYRLDVPLVYPDGTNRNQFVWARTSENATKDGRSVFYFQSRAGILTPQTDLRALLREALYGIYTMICIMDETDPDGNPIETVYVQASPIVDYCQHEDIVYDCILECAIVADYLEKKYFGGSDTH